MIEDILEIVAKYVIPSLIVTIVGFVIYWYKKIENQNLRNQLNELDLTLKKIQFTDSTKPIDQLINDSNKQHNASPDIVGQESGDSIKKE